MMLSVGWTMTAAAAIAVGTNGSTTETFDGQPLVTEWSTQSIPGINFTFSTRDAFDAAVQTNEAATITNALVVPFGGSCCAALAIWATNAGAFPRTAMLRPNSVAATLLMTTLRNNTMRTLSSLHVSHEFDATAFTTEEFGIRLFYSLTGRSNSWHFVYEYTNATTGNVTNKDQLEFSFDVQAWPPGALLYLL